MKYFIFLTCAVLFFVGLIGFTGNRTTSAALGKTKKKKPTFAQTLTAELAELAKSPVRTTVEGRQETARMEKDSSIIQTIYDSFGNKTESRVFYNDLFLKMVVLRTSANGQQEALVYGQNGEVKIAPQNLLGKVLTSVAGEIAKTVEIFDGRRENEMLARLNAPPVALNEEFSLLNLNQTPVEEVAPVAETAPMTEPVETKVETVVETSKVEENKIGVKAVQTEDSALKLRAVVQSLKAVKKARPEFSTNDLTAKAN